MVSDKMQKGIQRGEILYYNNCAGNKNELINQFNEVAKLNTRTEKPVWVGQFQLRFAG